MQTKQAEIASIIDLYPNVVCASNKVDLESWTQKDWEEAYADINKDFDMSELDAPCSYERTLAPEVKLRSLPSSKLVAALEDTNPPSYLVSGFLQRGHLVACTAPAGHHKTDLAINIALAVAGGNALHPNHPVRRKGRVLFLAGENPEDVKRRFMALADKYNYNWGVLNRIEFLGKAFDHTQKVDDLLRTYKGIEFDLVILDTAQAYGPREDSNSNTEMLKFALSLRKLRALGGPAVLVMAHPTLQAAKAKVNDFLPYGGSAFGNEVDGLLSIHRLNGSKIKVSHNAKWRGPTFDPLMFETGVIDDCARLRYTEMDDDGVEYVTQGTAPFIAPIVGGDGSQVGSQFHTLTPNQQMVVSGLMALTIKNGSAPEREDIVEYCLPQFEGKEEKTRKLTIKRTIDSLVRKRAINVVGMRYSVLPDFRGKA